MPELGAKALPVIVGFDHVEPKEPVRVVISDGRNAADRLAVEFAEEESIRISRVEAFRIVKARIPALARGPFKDQRKLMLAHVSNSKPRRIHGSASGSCELIGFLHTP